MSDTEYCNWELQLYWLFKVFDQFYNTLSMLVHYTVSLKLNSYWIHDHWLLIQNIFKRNFLLIIIIIVSHLISPIKEVPDGSLSHFEQNNLKI